MEAATINIHILSVVALHEPNFSSCLHFTMQNIEISCDLDRASRRCNVNVNLTLIDCESSSNFSHSMVGSYQLPAKVCIVNCREACLVTVW